MGNIYFIDRFPFNREFYNRNEFKRLKALGYNVKFLELSRFLKRRLLPNDIAEDIRDYAIRFESRKELYYFLKEQKADTLIVTTVPFVSSSAWMYYYIFKNNIPYIIEENASFPSFHKESGLSKRKNNIQHQLNTITYKKIINKPFESFYFIKALAMLKPANLHISSKVNAKTIFKRLSKKNTKRVFAASPDYKVAKRIKAIENENSPFVVFIDQYFCHHPDFKTKRITHSFSADKYYKEMNLFLRHFAKETGLRVIIAAHPRRQFEHAEDFDASFTVYYNKTAALIKKAEIVLLHFSTAISYAVIFNKPVLLIDSQLFEDSNIRKYIDNFKVLFGAKAINVSNYNAPIQPNSELFDINRSKYKAFIKNYLRHPQSSNHSPGDIILEHYKAIISHK